MTIALSLPSSLPFLPFLPAFLLRIWLYYATSHPPPLLHTILSSSHTPKLDIFHRSSIFNLPSILSAITPSSTHLIMSNLPSEPEFEQAYKGKKKPLPQHLLNEGSLLHITHKLLQATLSYDLARSLHASRKDQ